MPQITENGKLVGVFPGVNPSNSLVQRGTPTKPLFLKISLKDIPDLLSKNIMKMILIHLRLQLILKTIMGVNHQTPSGRGYQ